MLRKKIKDEAYANPVMTKYEEIPVPQPKVVKLSTTQMGEILVCNPVVRQKNPKWMVRAHTCASLGDYYNMHVFHKGIGCHQFVIPGGPNMEWNANRSATPDPTRYNAGEHQYGNYFVTFEPSFFETVEY